MDFLAAQILLTREDFNEEARSIKVKETIDSLLERGVVPVVNENDSISDEELKFGDNDILSALLASLTRSRTSNYPDNRKRLNDIGKFWCTCSVCE